MIFRKVIYIFVPLTSLLTLLGFGFSSWFFDSNEIKSQESDVTIKVSELIKTGDLRIIKCPNLIVFSEGVGKIDDLTDGIEFYRHNDDFQTNDEIYINDPEIIIEYEIIDKNDSLDYLSTSLFIEIDNGNLTDSLNNFISITSKYHNANTNDGYDFKKYIKQIDINETYPLGGFRYELNLNEVFQYKNMDVKPNTNDSYLH